MVSMQTNNYQGKSFRIINERNNSFRLFNPEQNREIAEFDTIAVKDYIASCRKLSFEYFSKLNRHQTDSVLNNKPVHIITIEDINKKQTVIKTFYRPGTGVINDNGEPYKYDIDRMYAQVNNDRQLIVIQQYAFNSILKNIDDFLK
jgi:hypothetical protein